MRTRLNFARVGALALWLPALSATAHAQNVEDEDIPDVVAPVQPAPNQTAPVVPPQSQTPQAQPVTPTAPANGETVTIPRAELEAMRAQQAEMQRQIDELKRIIGGAQGTKPPITPDATVPDTTPLDATVPDTVTPDTTTPDAASTEPGVTTDNRNYLLLPDISVITTGKGKLSNDRRDEQRNSLFLDELELGIQGYVYPNVKSDAFIVAHDDEVHVEEGYLTFQGLRKNLNVEVGRRFSAFGRTGQLHPHSWLYSRQLLPFRNLIAGEALTGDGVQLRYTIPASRRLFANFSLGLFNSAGHSHGAEGHNHGEEDHDHEGEEDHEGEDGHDDHGDDDDHEHDEDSALGSGVPVGRGASYDGRFYNARLWLGYALNRESELEIGTSYARGRSILEPEMDTETERLGHVALSGFDVSYRRFMSGNRRLLLRSEYFRNSPSRRLQNKLERASGYYGLANYRFNKYDDIGLLYENSGFPQAPGEREKAMSLIYTRRLTEQFFIRLQGTRGNRPGSGNYNEATLQFTWGLGPHTHNLE